MSTPLEFDFRQDPSEWHLDDVSVVQTTPPPAATGSVAINDLNIVEGNSGTQVATFTVTRTGTGATAPFDVSYATADSTATLRAPVEGDSARILRRGRQVGAISIAIPPNALGLRQCSRSVQQGGLL
jgi:hypothetical protein